VNEFLGATIAGIVYGAGYALIASGFVLTYTTSRIFNMGHGAMAMGAGFIYWDMAFRHHMPRLLALLIVVGIIAPIFGVVVDRLIMRNLAQAPVNISLVVTVGVFFLIYGAVQKFYPSDQIGTISPLMKSVTWHAPGGTINGNDILTVLCALGAAVAFYFFFKLTRTGVAMRAVVDNRNLLSLQGASPGFMSGLSWAIGSSLAALAGILLSADSSYGLNYLSIPLLVITAYAAAVLGKLESLPLTFIGSLALGLAYEYGIHYLPEGQAWHGLNVGLPAILLFLVLVVLPRAPLRVGQIRGIRAVPIASWPSTVVFGVGLVLVVWIIAPHIGAGESINPTNVSLIFVFGSMMLSLVLLTGYGGYLNLAPLAFAGIGAVTMVKLHSSSPYVLVVAAAVAGAIGAVLGLLAIRLGTLYLAIATFAFAELIDFVVFQSSLGFGSFGDARTVKRWNFFGYHLTSDQNYLVFTSIVFVLLGALVLALRRGKYGRLLIALRDSPAACGTLGLNITYTRVGLFAVSAAIAGLSGAVFGGLVVSLNATQFNVLQNLPVVLMAVVGGLTSVTGALFGGILLVAVTKTAFVIPIVHIRLDSIGGMLIGIAAILLARNPNGLISYAFQLGRAVLRPGSGGGQESAPTEGSRAAEPVPSGLREEVTVGGTA
jgi:branched-chain amino acid transport system permease protein